MATVKMDVIVFAGSGSRLESAHRLATEHLMDEFC